jgi:NIMA-interacting peptidyl-prolyl cis-trans isomerase 1
MRRALAVLVTCAACQGETGSPSPPPPTTASTPPPAAAPPPTPAAAPTPAAPPAPPDTVIAQHILCCYKGARRAPKAVTRTKADARGRAQEALAKVRAGAAFEDVVKQYSDDAGSVDRMGSVGKFHRDDMDPAFSTAAFALKPGEVSDVVETPFGFHVIKRTQ